jgi:hypothetical protein
VEQRPQDIARTGLTQLLDETVEKKRCAPPGFAL